MRVLVISDEVEPHLYGPGAARLQGTIDVLVSCGDLPFYYLEYLAGTLNVPSYFIFGNHGFELEHRADEIAIAHPRVGTNLHGTTVNERGLLMAGLEGCMRYNPCLLYTSNNDFVLQLGRRVAANGAYVTGQYIRCLLYTSRLADAY